MNPVALGLSTILLAVSIFAQSADSPDRKDARAAVQPNVLLTYIQRTQRQFVRASYGPLEHQCFTDADLVRFVRAGIPGRVAATAKSSAEFRVLISSIRPMSVQDRERLLRAARNEFRPTWEQLGRISPEGQSEAGQQADRLIAQVIAAVAVQMLSVAGST